MKRVAAVVIFDGLSEKEVERILRQIDEVVGADVREYDDYAGDPVWYIP